MAPCGAPRKSSSARGRGIATRAVTEFLTRHPDFRDLVGVVACGVLALGGMALGACQPGDSRARPAAAGQSPASADPAARPGRDSGADDWRLTPGQTGPMGSQTSEAELRRRYGTAAVDSIRVELGEGETAPGTVLYPADSLRRLEIIWRDTLARRQPTRLILRGPRSVWQVGPGISLGTSLSDLERLNGRPFTLAGFGWDYAGVITDWRGGALDSALTGVKLYVDPGPGQDQSAAYSQVLGDRDYSSSLPAMQRLNPKVAQIFVDFE